MNLIMRSQSTCKLHQLLQEEPVVKEIILYNLLDDLDLDNWKPINLSPTKLVKGTSSLFPCHICDKSYRHNKDLLRHIRVKHERPKTYSCIICKKEFGYKSSLRSSKVFLNSKLVEVPLTMINTLVLVPVTMNNNLVPVLLTTMRSPVMGCW